MVEVLEDGTQKVYCDRCSTELSDKVVVMNSGDCICERCFAKEYRIMTAEQYLTPED